METPNPPVQTIVGPFDEAVIADAARRILAGECVAVPTETVYGLAADATNGEAVAGIYAAKGRPSFNPLIVHVPTLEAAKAIATFNPAAEDLAAAFWPGPLTLVLPLKPNSPVAAIVAAGLDTIAVRVPAHPAMLSLLRATNRPLAAPSANASGRISPTRAAHVLAGLSGKVGLIVDAGPTGHGLESTIAAPTAAEIRLLRPGPIDRERIEAATGLPVSDNVSDAIEAPGQMMSHYAPAKPVRLGASQGEPGEWLIGFGNVAGDATLSASGDLVEAAARLFDALHEADASAASRIAVAPIPETGLGIAINDRLRRAAADR